MNTKRDTRSDPDPNGFELQDDGTVTSATPDTQSEERLTPSMSDAMNRAIEKTVKHFQGDDELTHIMGLCRGKHECWWSENIVNSDMDEQQIDWAIYGAIHALISKRDAASAHAWTEAMNAAREQARQELLSEFEKIVNRRWGEIITEEGDKAVLRVHLNHFINSKRTSLKEGGKKE